MIIDIEDNMKEGNLKYDEIYSMKFDEEERVL